MKVMVSEFQWCPSNKAVVESCAHANFHNPHVPHTCRQEANLITFNPPMIAARGSPGIG